MSKKGIASLSPGRNNSSLIQSIESDSLIRAVRVKSIVLSESHPLFEEVGGWNGLGTIEYQEVDNPQVFDKYPTAKPLNSNTKQFPLINEIVYILYLPDTNIGEFTSNGIAYYLDKVSLWNHPHHNGYPADPNILPDSQQKDYVQTQAGSVRRVTDQSTEIRLGNTFIERSNIHPILPFEGDIIQEGRWGNSIRFGSTVNKTQSFTKTTPINQVDQAKQQFTSGESNLSNDFITSLDMLNSEVNTFASQYPEYKISIFIKAGESQVPNPSPYNVGDLAKLRLSNLKNNLKNYSLLNSNISESTIIGQTPYTQGVDNPSDPKYLAEQFISVSLYLQATKTETITENNISLNPWSEIGTNGDPITIIRNGQGQQTEEGWVPTLEDINNDNSSVYLTSTQKIPLLPSSYDYSSYSTAPESIENYAGKQIMINSGRLVFNSTEDHILFSSTKSIGLNSLESINIDSPNTTFQSEKIFLGSKNATEPILKGDVTIDLISQLIEQLTNLTIALKTVTPQGGPAVAPAAMALEPFLRTLKTQFETQTKSKVSKTL